MTRNMARYSARSSANVFSTDKRMKVLVACEFSGVVRDAFTAAGHDAMSCDLLDSETPGKHYKGDVLDTLFGQDNGYEWDLIIAHPPCTYLASSGARWWPRRLDEQADALSFVYKICTAPCQRIAIENPVGRLSAEFRKPDQIIQPWQFGHPEWKTTCLWLKGLPPLVPTAIVEPDKTVGGGNRPGRISSAYPPFGTEQDATAGAQPDLCRDSRGNGRSVGYQVAGWY
jgi:hypothetical protein